MTPLAIFFMALTFGILFTGVGFCVYMYNKYGGKTD